MRAVWWPVLSVDAPAIAPAVSTTQREAERFFGRWGRLARSTALAACYALSGLACDSTDEGPSVYALQLDVIEGHGELSQHWIRDELEHAVRGSTMFAHGDTQRASTPLSAGLRLATLQTADDVEVLRVELTVDQPPERIRAALGRDFEAIIEIERVHASLVLEEDLPVALRRAVTVLETKALLVRGDKAALERILAHPDPELVVLGVEWIARHRLREHADAVAGLAEHPDDRVALRAVECLGVVGAQEHARVLVAKPRLADRAHARRLYETLAGLGGPDAVGFLEFAVRNEEDPAMAAIAKRALELAQHRQDGDAGGRTRAPVRRGHR
jgi:hypothetical protein